MRKTEYVRQRKEIQQERDALAQALAKVDARLAALDIVWNEIYKGGTEPCDQPAETVCVPNESEEMADNRAVVVNGEAQRLIDEAANALADAAVDFGVKEIQHAIHTLNPEKTVNRTTVAGRLRKLAAEGKIEIVEAGSGRRPGRFKGRSAA